LSTGQHSDLEVNAFGSTSPPRVLRSNLIGFNTNSGLIESPIGSPDADGNLIGGPINGAIDPLLGPLADNGGPTLTHALLPGSPAINAGDPAAMPGEGGVPVHDQRGAPFTRVYGGRIDIGAVESQPWNMLIGDYNLNGVVDAADYGVWRDEMENGIGTVTHADGNGDGAVDEWDFLVWRNNYGATLADLSAPGGILAAPGIILAAPAAAVAIVADPPQPSEVARPLALATTSFVGAGDNSGLHVARRAGRAMAPRVADETALRRDQLLATWAASLTRPADRLDPGDALARGRRHANEPSANAEVLAVDRVFSRMGTMNSGRIAGKLRLQSL
jgi:hypothetical protein